MQYLKKPEGSASKSRSDTGTKGYRPLQSKSHPGDTNKEQTKIEQQLQDQAELLARTRQALQAEISARLQAEEELNRLSTKLERSVQKRYEELARIKDIEEEKAELFNRVKQQHEQLNNLALQLRQLTHQVIMAQEEERRRVSRELHDEAGQALTVLKVSLELIRADLLESQAEAMLCKRLDEAVGLCESTMTRIRMLAHDLRPAALDDLGLNLTLEGFCRDFSERTQLSIFYAGVETPALMGSAEICLYRCLQEGLTNVAKHACATQVLVRLHYDENSVRLVIEDNGRGFDQLAENLLKSHKEGIGILGLQERLVSLGGRLEINSQAGKGACLSVIVPRAETG